MALKQQCGDERKMMNKMTYVDIPEEVNGPSEIVTRKRLKIQVGARQVYTIPPTQPAGL